MAADPLHIAVEVAREAGSLLMDYLRRPLHITQKSRRADLVTDADRAAEKLILHRLRLEFPTSTIVGEESGTHTGTSHDVWYVDPLDGTTNFAHGYPMFCVSIGFERAGELVCGVVYAPHFGELYVAQKGAGATLNGEPMSCSSISQVADALVCTGFHPADYERNGEYFKIMSNKAQAVRRDGSAALDLAAVAAGRFDGFWEFDLSPWDVAAGTVLIRESGGTVSAIDGGAFSVHGRSILATNVHVDEEMRAILQF
ncbi:MAG: inositol monophosphatase family protein [Candidatus Baltobacteraceae bacterium]